MAHSNGDLTAEAQTSTPCVAGAKTISGFFLLSFEAQSTLGGEYYATDECPESVFLLSLQMISSVAIEGILIGIVYAKLFRPTRKLSERNFSQKAVINKRDEKLCLLIRVCDPNETHVIDTKIQAFFIGEKMLVFQSCNLRQRNVFLLIQIYHLFAVLPKVIRNNLLIR